MIFSRFFLCFSLCAVASASRFLEEAADPCADATSSLRETDAYANATATLLMALDDFEANATGVCVIVDGRMEWYVWREKVFVRFFVNSRSNVIIFTARELFPPKSLRHTKPAVLLWMEP